MGSKIAMPKDRIASSPLPTPNPNKNKENKTEICQKINLDSIAGSWKNSEESLGPMVSKDPTSVGDKAKCYKRSTNSVSPPALNVCLREGMHIKEEYYNYMLLLVSTIATARK